jgi:hypothetical protein
MDRASGVYKSASQIIVFIISLTISASFNVDTINIVNKLWNNQQALKLTADNFQGTYQTIKDAGYNPNTDKIILDGNKMTVDKAKSTGDTTKVDTSKTQPNGKKVLEQVNAANTFLASSGIPVGWSAQNTPILADKTFGQNFLAILIKIAGILLTSIALMLGAPFWFDLINKVVNIRAVGKKPEEKAAGK